MKRNRGFTLIELMIAVVVLAIIVSIALPAYTNQITETRRAEGKAELMTVAHNLERCYTRFSEYDNANCPVIGALPIMSENGWYQVDADDAGITATTYNLTATPQNAQASNDTVCANLGLDHVGRKTESGTGTVNDCW